MGSQCKRWTPFGDLRLRAEIARRDKYDQWRVEHGLGFYDSDKDSYDYSDCPTMADILNGSLVSS